MHALEVYGPVLLHLLLLTLKQKHNLHQRQLACTPTAAHSTRALAVVCNGEAQSTTGSQSHS